MKRILALATLVAPCGGCVYRPLPVPIAPPTAVALAEPLTPETLAVLDFSDRRPDFERSELPIDEKPLGSRWLVDDRFYSFHPEEGTLATDPAPPPHAHGRVTGTGAFGWYPFPNPGVGAPGPAPIDRALADYVALRLEQRGVAARVIRARDEAAARASGATLLLAASVERFGTVLAEAHDPYVPRPDDWIEFRLLGCARLSVELRRLEAAQPLFAADFLGRDEEIHLFDELARYRGSQVRPLYRLDAADFPRFAMVDMVAHARRALERATAPLLADVERVLAPPAPPPAP